MKMPLLAAATALMLLGTAGAASAKDGKDARNKAESHAKGNSDARDHVYRDCDGVSRAHHDNRDKKGKDCNGNNNRFDRRDGRAHDARRSFEGPRYVGPRDYRYVRYDSGARLPQGYYGGGYYVDHQAYDLAPPPQGYRWNRVGTDVYMVSVRDGLIAEAVYSLFR